MIIVNDRTYRRGNQEWTIQTHTQTLATQDTGRRQTNQNNTT
jgi:hypothetical protein